MGSGLHRTTSAPLELALEALTPLEMSNKYLSYDDQRAPKVREMFSRLAERYDLVNDVMSFGMHRKWKREAVRLALPGISKRPARVRQLPRSL